MPKHLRIRIISWLAACFAALPMIVSCEQDIISTPEVSIAENSAGAEAGYTVVDVSASGAWLLSLYYPDGAEPWAGLTSTQGSGSKDGIILSYGENPSEESRTLKVILSASGYDLAVTFTQEGRTAAGDEPEPEPDPEPEPGPASGPGWLELPELAETEACHFYWHDMTQNNGKRVRNYSFLWDKENLVAHWVAYPLNKRLIGSGYRSEAWGYDPKVPVEDQPELYRGYRGGYDRGHQLPSADRYTDNESTFYFTNMTPQIGTGFNQSVWADLEIQVRDWSYSSDTLYVVTGCVLEGSLGKAYDNLGKEVTIPGGYFKALLWYNHASTMSFGQWSAAGFYFEHKSGASRQTMSIDDLEEITGIDFFVNLPARIGQDAADRIEAAEPGAFWN